ncbi:MAG TPA: hypothetical protein VGF45_21130 [Polyangia bacterium]
MLMASSSSRRSRLLRPLLIVALLLVLIGVGVVLARRDAPNQVANTPPAAPAAAAAAPPPVAYDPTKLLENGVNAGEVFAEEPRSAGWADAVESAVGAAMNKDFAATVPGAVAVIKCKTLSCLVGIDAPADKRQAALAVSKVVTVAPWVVELPPEDDGTLRWLFFQEVRFADPAAFVSWYSEVRERTLAAIREGKLPNPYPVPASEVPRD